MCSHTRICSLSDAHIGRALVRVSLTDAGKQVHRCSRTRMCSLTRMVDHLIGALISCAAGASLLSY